MQLTYFDGTVTSEGASEEIATQEAALAMLKVIELFIISWST